MSDSGGHPLDDDAACVSAVSWWRVLGPTDARSAGEPDWVRCQDLITGSSEWIGRIEAWLGSAYGVPVPAAVAPTYAMGWYLDALARTVGYWLEQTSRVPDLAPGRWSLALDGGRWPSAAAVHAGPFHCLPGDPAADHQDAIVVDHRDQLVEAVRTVTRGQADAFFDGFAPAVRIGSRQRYGMLADHLETALISGGEAAGDRLAGLDDAYLVAGPGPGGLRRSCCFAFALSDELLCTRCPRRRCRA